MSEHEGPRPQETNSALPERSKEEKARLRQGYLEAVELGLAKPEGVRFVDYLNGEPNTTNVDHLKDSKQEVNELENIFADFEQTHNIEELFAIEEMTTEQLLNDPVRKSAKEFLAKIKKILDTLEETNIEPGKYYELLNKYKHFSRAVGIANRGWIDHTR